MRTRSRPGKGRAPSPGRWELPGPRSNPLPRIHTQGLVLWLQASPSSQKTCSHRCLSNSSSLSYYQQSRNLGALLTHFVPLSFLRNGALSFLLLLRRTRNWGSEQHSEHHQRVEKNRKESLASCLAGEGEVLEGGAWPTEQEERLSWSPVPHRAPEPLQFPQGWELFLVPSSSALIQADAQVVAWLQLQDAARKDCRATPSHQGEGASGLESGSEKLENKIPEASGLINTLMR